MYYDVQKSAERIRDLRIDSNLTQSGRNPFRAMIILYGV